jgi:hypothetical protein
MPHTQSHTRRGLCHGEAANRAVAEVIGSIEGQVAAFAQIRGVCRIGNALFTGNPPWVKETMPRHFSQVLESAKRYETANLRTRNEHYRASSS